jgi:hypothetical protein
LTASEEERDLRHRANSYTLEELKRAMMARMTDADGADATKRAAMAWEKLWTEVETVIGTAFRAALHGWEGGGGGTAGAAGAASGCRYKWYGVDVLLQETPEQNRYKPYLLEVNRNPAVGKNWTRHGAAKSDMLLDSMRMMAGSLQDTEVLRALAEHEMTQEREAKGAKNVKRQQPKALPEKMWTMPGAKRLLGHDVVAAAKAWSTFAGTQTKRVRERARRVKDEIKLRAKMMSAAKAEAEKAAEKAKADGKEMPPMPKSMPMPTPMATEGVAAVEGSVDGFDWGANPSPLALYALAEAMAEHRRRGVLRPITTPDAAPVGVPVGVPAAAVPPGSETTKKGAKSPPLPRHAKKEGGQRSTAGREGYLQRSTQHMHAVLGAVGRVYTEWALHAGDTQSGGNRKANQNGKNFRTKPKKKRGKDKGLPR